MKGKDDIWLQITTFWISVYQAPFIFWTNYIKENKKK